MSPLIQGGRPSACDTRKQRLYCGVFSGSVSLPKGLVSSSTIVSPALASTMIRKYMSPCVEAARCRCLILKEMGVVDHEQQKNKPETFFVNEKRATSVTDATCG